VAAELAKGVRPVVPGVPVHRPLTEGVGGRGFGGGGGEGHGAEQNPGEKKKFFKTQCKTKATEYLVWKSSKSLQQKCDRTLVAAFRETDLGCSQTENRFFMSPKDR
jgi:hypothetical protein